MAKTIGTIAIGAIVGAIAVLGAYAIHLALPYKDGASGKEAGRWAIRGAVSGALVSIIGLLPKGKSVNPALQGALLGGLAEAISCWALGDPVNLTNVAKAMAAGGITGAIGGALLKWLNQNVPGCYLEGDPIPGPDEPANGVTANAIEELIQGAFPSN